MNQRGNKDRVFTNRNLSLVEAAGYIEIERDWIANIFRIKSGVSHEMKGEK